MQVVSGTEVTGDLWGRRISGSGRPMADTMIIMVYFGLLTILSV